MSAVWMLKSSCVSGMSPLWTLSVASWGGSQSIWAEVTLKCVWGCLDPAAFLTVIENEPTITAENSWSPVDFSHQLCAAPPQFCGQQLPCCSFVCLSLISLPGSCFLFWMGKCFKPNYIKASFVPLSAGYDFCAEGLICGENSECKNRNTKAECECRSGYASIHGDSTYCEGRTPGVFQLLFSFWQPLRPSVVKTVVCNKLSGDGRRAAWTAESILGMVRI